jgi:hypothetical protein
MSLKLKPVDFSTIWSNLEKTTWSNLEKTVERVITLEKVPHIEWFNGFSDVFSLCKGKSESEQESEISFAKKLYQETENLLKKHVESLYMQVNGTSQEQLLTVYYTLWQQYSQGMDYLDKLYS